MKLQGVLHWVAEPSPGVDPLKVEVRLFDRLFRSEVYFLYFVELIITFFPPSERLFLETYCCLVFVKESCRAR